MLHSHSHDEDYSHRAGCRLVQGHALAGPVLAGTPAAQVVAVVALEARSESAGRGGCEHRVAGSTAT